QPWRPPKLLRQARSRSGVSTCGSTETDINSTPLPTRSPSRSCNFAKLALIGGQIPLQVVKMKFTATIFPLTRSLRNCTRCPSWSTRPTSGMAPPHHDCSTLPCAAASALLPATTSFSQQSFCGSPAVLPWAGSLVGAAIAAPTASCGAEGPPDGEHPKAGSSAKLATSNRGRCLFRDRVTEGPPLHCTT